VAELNSSDEEKANDAAFSLGYEGDVRALPRLRVLLGSTDLEIKGHAILAMGNIEHKDVPDLLLMVMERETDIRVRTTLLEACKAKGARAKERDAALRLIRVGTPPDSDGSEFTYECLDVAATGGGARPADFTALLKKKHIRERPRLKRDVLEALASMCTVGSADALREIAVQDDEETARQAIWALRRVAGEGDRDAEGALAEVARSGGADIAKRARAFLSEIAHERRSEATPKEATPVTPIDPSEHEKPTVAVPAEVEATEEGSTIPAISAISGAAFAAIVGAYFLRRRLQRGP